MARTIPAKWTSELQSLARIIFGFLVFRHGMEQVLGFPAAFPGTDYDMLSFGGLLKTIAFPAGILIMLGLFTRPVSFGLACLYLVWWFVGPLQIGLQADRALFGARGPSDPVLLNGFFFLYLATTGPGAWSVDRLTGREGKLTTDSPWAGYSLAALRIVAAFLFIFHGIDKVWGRIPLDLTSLRALAATLELVGGPMLMAGLFTRPLAFLLSGEMAFAYFMNHAPQGFWGSFVGPNQEAAILNCFLFLFFWGAGPGAWSLDGWRQRTAAGGRVKLESAV